MAHFTPYTVYKRHHLQGWRVKYRMFFAAPKDGNIRIQRYSNRKKLNSVHIRCRLSVFEIMQRAKVKNGVILQSAGRTSLLEI